MGVWGLLDGIFKIIGVMLEPGDATRRVEPKTPHPAPDEVTGIQAVMGVKEERIGAVHGRFGQERKARDRRREGNPGGDALGATDLLDQLARLGAKPEAADVNVRRDGLSERGRRAVVERVDPMMKSA